jgi:hypothetical protein
VGRFVAVTTTAPSTEQVQVSGSRPNDGDDRAANQRVL